MSSTVNTGTMSRTKQEQQALVAQSRKQHHQNQLANKTRVDAYITPESKAQLKHIKAMFSEVKNEGQAIDKAIALAGEAIKNT